MRSKSKTDLLSIIKHAKFSVAVTPDKTGGGGLSRTFPNLVLTTKTR